MKTPTDYRPAGHPSAVPYLIVKGAAQAIEFYCKAFGATETFRMAGPVGGIAHAEIKIDESPIMLADESPQMGARSPATIGGTPVFLCIYVRDCDAVVQKAVAGGAKILRPLENQFYGDRAATVLDPFGHQWTIATHIEDVSPEEIMKRAAAMFGGKKG
jgi:PhnB protein